MGQDASFQQILESKMQEARPTSQSKTQHKEQSQQAFNESWAQLLGHLSPLRTAESAVKERLSTKAYAAFRPKPKVIPQPAAPKHIFNGEQASAFGFMKSSGASLEENFTKKDLLKAFRTLAFKLHPDQGGTAQDFQALLKARTCLQTLFN